MRTKYNFTGLLYFSIFFVSNLNGQKEVTLKSIPQWVNLIEFESSENLDNSPFLYLLSENQENNITQEDYFHYAIQLFNSEGVQEMSSVSVSYDPNYQTVGIHHIRVHRNGEIQERDIKNFQFLRQETDIQRAIYDGSITAVKELKDIRAGDIIEFSFTVKGYNPIYGNHKLSSFYQDYNVPLNRLYKSVISDRELNMTYQNSATEPTVTKRNGNWIYSWDILDVAQQEYESTAPYWIEQYKLVTMSSMKNWHEVNKWALSLYSLTRQDKQSIKKELSEKLSLANTESGILEAIRFVQDEIRYLGFEEGIKAFKPNKPIVVLNQRFGDCKDKSLLLSSILNMIGLDASPMLVSTNNLNSIEEYVPNPNVFNHCIVTFERNGTQYYVDPTIAHEGGNLKNMSVPEYVSGLEIKEGVKKLRKFEEDLIPIIHVTEAFEVDSIGGGAEFNISTKYNGSQANNIRSYFSSNSRLDIKQNYNDFYINSYPGIEILTLELVDTTRSSVNEITVKETYRIPKIWKEDGEVLRFSISSLVLQNYVNLSQPQNYENQYWLGSKIEFIQNTKIKLQTEWPINNSQNEIKNKYFDYKNNITYNEKTINLTQRYYLKEGEVASSDVQNTLKDLEKINDDISYTLTYDKSFFDSQNSNKIAYVIWACLFFGLIISMKLIKWVYFEFDPIPQNRESGIPIGGWLILPVIGLVLTPFRMLYEHYLIIEEGSYSSATFKALWSDESIENGKVILALISGEAFINFVMFFMVFAIIFLFFKRRSNVPYLMIGFYIFSFVFLLVDSILAYFLIEESTIIDKDIFRSFVSTCIWAPYFVLSQRVKSTFNVQLKPTNLFKGEEEE